MFLLFFVSQLTLSHFSSLFAYFSTSPLFNYHHKAFNYLLFLLKEKIVHLFYHKERPILSISFVTTLSNLWSKAQHITQTIHSKYPSWSYLACNREQNSPEFSFLILVEKTSANPYIITIIYVHKLEINFYSIMTHNNNNEKDYSIGCLMDKEEKTNKLPVFCLY